MAEMSLGDWFLLNFGGFGKPTPPPEPLGTSYSGSNDKPTEPAPETPEQKSLRLIEEFIASLNEPLDPNDPAVKMVLDQMRMDSTQNAENRGLYGGYSNAAGEQAYAKGYNQLDLQRKGMLGNALGMFSGAAQNQRDFRYQQEKDKYANQMDLWKFDQANSPGAKMGGIIGGIGGAVLGGFGGDIFGGAQAGYQLGTNIGGMGYSTPPPTFKGYG